jgi:hypothetical protein
MEGEDHDAFVQRAIEFEAKHGVWPPDPLLDEVAEMRRNVLAEYGGDYRKLWASYVEHDRQAAEQEAALPTPGKQKRPAA